MGKGLEKKCRKPPPSKQQKAVKRSRVHKCLSQPANVQAEASCVDSLKKKNIIRIKQKSAAKKRSGPESKKHKMDRDVVDDSVDDTVGVSCISRVPLILPCEGIATPIQLDGSPSSTGKKKKCKNTVRVSVGKTESTKVPATNNNTCKKQNTQFKKSVADGLHDNIGAACGQSANISVNLSLASKLTPLRNCLYRNTQTLGATSCSTKASQKDKPRVYSDTSRSESEKIEDVPAYNPCMSYTSTVVTMTNNMNAIKEHSKADSSHRLLELINNVHRSEEQITSVIASVDSSQQVADGTAGTDSNWRLVQLGDEMEQTDMAQQSRERSEDIRNSLCHSIDSNCTLATTSPSTSRTRQHMDRLANQQLDNNARLLWLSERGWPSGADDSDTWAKLSTREKQPYIQRARSVMSEPALPPKALQGQTTSVRPRKRNRADCSGAKAKVSKRGPEAKTAKPKASSNLVLTVTHATPAPLPLTATVVESFESSQAKEKAENSQAKEKTEAKKGKLRKISGPQAPLIKEDYGSCQEAQRFYSMSGEMQKHYLERELYECRGVMTRDQCKTMLNDYKNEYLDVRHTFISTNNLMSSQTKKENLEIIQRSILYNRIQFHKQQAIASRTYSCMPTDFAGQVDSVLDNTTVPSSISFPYSPDLSLTLDVLNSVPAYPMPSESLSAQARQSDSFQSILDELVSTAQLADNNSHPFDLPLLLSESALAIHSET